MPTTKEINDAECLRLLARLNNLVAQGRFERVEERNSYLLWRFDLVAGVGSIKAYSNSKKKKKVVYQPEWLYDALDSDDWSRLSSQVQSTIPNQNGSIREISENSAFNQNPSILNRSLNLTNELSKDQENCFSCILKWLDDKSSKLLTFGGYAGTGKTTIAAHLARKIPNGTRVAFCAYTGKAASVLRRKLSMAGASISPESCTTIHRLLYKPVEDEHGRVFEWKKVSKIPADLILVDEASMVGREIWNDLTSYGVKVLAIGDHGQLPPVGDDSVNLVANPQIKLDQIHRQAQGNLILAFSQFVREGYLPENFNNESPALKIQRECSYFETELSSLIQSVDDFKTTAICCYKNSTRNQINRFLRKQFAFDTLSLATHEPVICLRNKKLGYSHGFMVSNGSRGFVQSIKPESLDQPFLLSDIVFPDESFLLENARLCRAQFGRDKTLDNFTSYQSLTGETINNWTEASFLMDYTYAITVHKAQGSEFSRVIVLDEFPRDAPNYSRWLYTAATRARDQLVVLTKHRI